MGDCHASLQNTDKNRIVLLGVNVSSSLNLMSFPFDNICYLYITSFIKDGLMFWSRLRHDHDNMHSSGIVSNIINKHIVFLFTVNSQTLEYKMEWLVFKSSNLICQCEPKISRHRNTKRCFPFRSPLLCTRPREKEK